VSNWFVHLFLRIIIRQTILGAFILYVSRLNFAMENDGSIPFMDATTDSNALLTVTDSRPAANEVVLAWSHVRVECRQQSTFRYGFRQVKHKAPHILLDDLSGIARPGQIVAIMGTSGVGKTTLLKVLSGHDDPQMTVTNGDVLLNGSTTTRPQRLSGSIIGLVEQNELFVETMSLEEHLIFQVFFSCLLYFYMLLVYKVGYVKNATMDD
jgi:ABC-type bacteriocin/lantibiotic exporter with double-glycine peptidase domain